MTGTHHYCFATDVEGHVNPRFDSDIRAYSGLEGLEELKKLGRPAASENRYLDYQVVDLDTGETAYHRERRVHSQERTTASEDASDFYAWLREQAVVRCGARRL